MEIFLFIIIILFCLSPLLYLFLEDVHEKEHYDSYLVKRNGEYYLLLKEKIKVDWNLSQILIYKSIKQ